MIVALDCYTLLFIYFLCVLSKPIYQPPYHLGSVRFRVSASFLITITNSKVPGGLVKEKSTLLSDHSSVSPKLLSDVLFSIYVKRCGRVFQRIQSIMSGFWLPRCRSRLRNREQATAHEKYHTQCRLGYTIVADHV